jgi:hypothetical protein
MVPVRREKECSKSPAQENEYQQYQAQWIKTGKEGRKEGDQPKRNKGNEITKARACI